MVGARFRFFFAVAAALRAVDADGAQSCLAGETGTGLIQTQQMKKAPPLYAMCDRDKCKTCTTDECDADAERPYTFGLSPERYEHRLRNCWWGWTEHTVKRTGKYKARLATRKRLRVCLRGSVNVTGLPYYESKCKKQSEYLPEDGVPGGRHFSFDEDEWKNAFGRPLKHDHGYTVAQWRNGKEIWSGRVTTYSSPKAYGLRSTGARCHQWREGDTIVAT